MQIFAHLVSEAKRKELADVKRIGKREFRKNGEQLECKMLGFERGEMKVKWFKVCMQNGFSLMEKRQVWSLFNY